MHTIGFNRLIFWSYCRSGQSPKVKLWLQLSAGLKNWEL